MTQLKFSLEDDLKIWIVEYLINHWLDLTSEWIILIILSIPNCYNWFLTKCQLVTWWNMIIKTIWDQGDLLKCVWPRNGPSQVCLTKEQATQVCLTQE